MVAEAANFKPIYGAIQRAGVGPLTDDRGELHDKGINGPADAMNSLRLIIWPGGFVFPPMDGATVNCNRSCAIASLMG
ncbi:hypothetical protein ACP70R_025310 [Stipagrostis hirtigluma subsp. patula]